VTAWRAALRPHRPELVAIAVLSIVVLLFAGGLVIRLLAIGIPTECLSFDAGTNAACNGLDRLREEYQSTAGQWSQPVFAAIAVLPLLSGLVLGVSLVAKELDQGTTTLAWSIGPSRRRWLLLRVLPIALFVVGAALVATLIGELVLQLRERVYGPMQPFEGLGFRGVVVIAEALSTFGIALLVGSLLGRLLPAILLSATLIFGSYAGIGLVNDTLLRSESLVVEQTQFLPGREIESLVRTPEGEVITYEEAYARYGDDLGEMSETSQLRQVVRFNPVEIYPLVVVRMAVLHAALGFALLALTFAVVDRRRP
jgi:ABC-type transport system involved in multi-copper enzyme maturation permease subunit